MYICLGVIGLDNHGGSNKELKEIQEENPFIEQLNEINEWQNNSTNPGYFIEKGSTPLPIKNISRSPVLMIIVGILFAIPTVIYLIGDFTLGNILSSSVMILISTSFIVGGILRLKRKCRR